MGQYYKACLINEKEIKIISPSGWKMMEHSWYGNHDMLRVEKLLSEAHYRVIWLWDYSQCAAFAWDSCLQPEKEWDEDYGDSALLKHEPNKVYYLVNHTRQEYINMNKQEVNDDLKDNYWDVVHPLWLLCRADTEEAGGDYHSETNQDLLWIWCGDEISVEIYDWDRDEEFKYFEYEDKTDIYFFKE